MDFKLLTPELISQLSLIVASKADKESNTEELCVQVFGSYVKAIGAYNKLIDPKHSVYEKRGVITL